MTAFAIYGTFGTGQPGHPNLEGAPLLERVRAAASYRLYLVEGRWPALVPAADGVELECELYECDEALLERLAALEPPGWQRGPLVLSDGREVEAFVADRELAARGVDVSEYGSWAAFVAGR
jgi:allophanate hydrolase